MITPAYSPTATERVLPRMALDFTTASLDARVTVTRSLNTATRVNSLGYIESVNANLPRFDFDPLTLICKGLLIEESRQNIYIDSSQFNSNWSKTNVLVDQDVEASPDNTTNGDALDENTATGFHRLFRAESCSVSTTYTFSVFIKAAGRDIVRLAETTLGGAYFDLTSGIKISNDSGITATINPYKNGWYRCSITGTTGSSQTLFVAQIQAAVFASGVYTTNYTGEDFTSLYLYGAQWEIGAFPTSYIPTTTTSLTRNADAVSMTGTNFSDWYNATEGTFVVWHDILGYTSSNMLVVASDSGTTNLNQIYMSGVTSGLYLVRTNNIGQASLTTATTLTGVSKTVGSYKTDSFAAASNGLTVATDPTGTLPVVDRLGIGSRLGSFVYNGHIYKVLYWPQRVTDNEVRSFSK